MAVSVKSSISGLSEFLIENMEKYFEGRGLKFDADAFKKEAGTHFEFVCETAHFSGTNLLEEPLLEAC